MSYIKLQKPRLKRSEDPAWSFDMREERLVNQDFSGMCLNRINLEGADLSGSNFHRASFVGANLRGARLHYASLNMSNFKDADLEGAEIIGACAHRANFTRANLRHADFSGTDITLADLDEAELEGAINLSSPGCAALSLLFAVKPFRHPFRGLLQRRLLYQYRPLRAFKLVGKDGCGVFHGGLRYRVGELISVKDASFDPRVLIGNAPGIYAATLNWCLSMRRSNNYAKGSRVIELSFSASDIACIPLATDGQLRLHRAKVMGYWPEQE